jgi:hypothetical protein
MTIVIKSGIGSGKLLPILSHKFKPDREELGKKNNTLYTWGELVARAERRS